MLAHNNSYKEWAMVALPARCSRNVCNPSLATGTSGGAWISTRTAAAASSDFTGGVKRSGEVHSAAFTSSGHTVVS